jgi:drug/metabolite transporter (DMT)-like permease
MVCLVGGLFLTVPAAAWECSLALPGEVSLGVVGGVIYLGVISTALAMYLWNRAFALLEAGTASLTFFAQPVVGAGLGAILLGESISVLFLIGAALIGAGLWLASRGSNRPA